MEFQVCMNCILKYILANQFNWCLFQIFLKFGNEYISYIDITSPIDIDQSIISDFFIEPMPLKSKEEVADDIMNKVISHYEKNS